MEPDSSSKETVLVTGGSGLVGQAIQEFIRDFELQELQPQEPSVISINKKFQFVFVSSTDANLTCDKQTGSLFNKHKPRYVINLAARVGGLYANMADSNESFYKVNKSINENILSWSHKFSVKKCISCLSTCIFPDKIDYPLDESKIHLGPPHPSNRGYAMAKREVDLLNRKYNQLNEGKSSLFTAIIPTNIYGKNDNFSLTTSHVVPGLVHKAYLAASRAKQECKSKATLEVFGSGRPLRQFIYAKDLAKLILLTLTDYNDPVPLILCPDEEDEISIGQVAQLICDNMSRLLEIEITLSFNTDYDDGQFKKTADNKKLRHFYSDFRFTPIHLGIRLVVEWFCASYPNIRK